MTIHRNINGKPYTLTRHGTGWTVCSAEALTDRFWRAYQVKVGADGFPIRCSCPYCFHSQDPADGSRRICKHMRAVEELWWEAHPEAKARLDEAVEDELVLAGYYDTYLEERQ